ncbi:protein GVQW3-like [Polypterus senegalus]|uniref:protein GVQW3-like n=1 Tax=Polypterus senegalus TaxID=55291 RepID=UPI0019668D67|nr:protein GVQW3-like [Polypterus senegalus]
MLSLKVEQRVNLKFLVKLNKTPTECFQMLTGAYGEYCMSRARVFEWHKRFSEGRENVEDNERPGRPSTSRTEENVEKIRQMVRKDRRLSVRMIAETINIDKDTAWKILREDLNMKKVYAKLVPRVLTPERKECRKKFGPTFCSKLRRSFFKKSSHVFKPGSCSTRMIQKQNDSQCTGKHCHHQE